MRGSANQMISGVHAMLFSKTADKTRKFFRVKLGLKSVDAGGGWLIFALPPAELGIHPTRGRSSTELYLMCDDIAKTERRLKAKGVKFDQPVVDAGWGLLTRIRLPDRSTIGLYEPRHRQIRTTSRSARTTTSGSHHRPTT
jgi:predicted enzyme related to lactoylglutathione lyase